MDQAIQSTKIKNILIYIVIAAIVFGVGYYLGASVEKNKAKGVREAMLKEIFSNIGFVNNLSGKISEIPSDKKTLVIEVPSVFGVNLPKEYQKKKIFIGENTEIVLRETKDLMVFEKEMTELNKKGEITPPLPYVEKEIKIDDLKVGDNVNVSFAPAENQSVLDNQFTAVRININR